MNAIPTCPTCGAEKHRRPSGRLVCKPCDQRRASEWAKNNRARSNEIKRKWSKANKDKEADYRERNRDRLKADKQAYYQANRDAIREQHRTYYQDTREERQQAIRAYAEAHRDDLTAYRRKHYQENREQYIARARANYAANREAIAEWHRQHPDIQRARNQLRRARQLAAICEHGPQCVTRDLLADLRAADCTYCGESASHADHFYPLARGGLHCRENLVPACQPCNLSKSTRDPEEWLRNGRFKAS